MARGRRDVFTSTHSEGGLLSPGLLGQVAEGRSGIPGLTPAGDLGT